MYFSACTTTLKLLFFNRYAVAESDCNLAIALDSNYFKAYLRRGAARFALNEHESALEGDRLFKL